VQGKRFDVLCCIVSSEEDAGPTQNGNFLSNVFKKFYAPFLLGFTLVRALVVLLFFLWLCASICLFPLVDVGLDQELSMPEDSYVLTYFQVSSEGISRLKYATGNRVQEASGFHAAEVSFPQLFKQYQTFFF
jgi:Niemann-Pick C1 protein